ncbi:MAG TPA: ATP-dependent protease [Candidatus Methanofastidiosa archaeon]|nr:ATP-dependent protease [Candidatus Methanofastidiosa archaeon]
MRKIFIALLLILMLVPLPLNLASQAFDYTVTVNAPAVTTDENGDYVGVISEMSASVSEGDGSIFVETWPLSEIDTQASARLAATVASEVCGVDLYDYNFYYTITSSSSVIGGPSAGGILTVATVAALNGWEVDTSVMMTGMINPDGTIGPVGGIYQKALAASEFGIKTFLVPEGQATVTYDGEVIDLTTYAPENWGMEVKEITDIYDAVYEFTGMEYESDEYTGDITIDTSFFSEDVTTEMESTQELRDEVTSALDSSDLSLSVKDDLEAYVDNADERLSDAEDAIDDGLYYSAMSFLFQARISYTYVDYALQYLNAGEDVSSLNELFDWAESYINDVDGEVKDTVSEIKGYSSLQAFSAAQERVFEAIEYIGDAKLYLVQGREPEALYDLAFAVERARTSEFWLAICNRYSEGDTVEVDELKTDAEVILNDANLTYIYAYNLMSSNSLLVQASDLLDSAYEEFSDENYAAALFNAIESKTRSSVAIELYSTGDDIIESRVERAKENAAKAIEEQISNGITPVLSMSYYEFATVFEEQGELESAMIYYKYANGIANAFKYLLGDAGDGYEPSSSAEAESTGDGGILNSPIEFASGFVVGLSLTFGAFLVYRRKFYKQQQL